MQLHKEGRFLSVRHMYLTFSILSSHCVMVILDVRCHMVKMDLKQVHCGLSVK